MSPLWTLPFILKLDGLCMIVYSMVLTHVQCTWSAHGNRNSELCSCSIYCSCVAGGKSIARHFILNSVLSLINRTHVLLQAQWEITDTWLVLPGQRCLKTRHGCENLTNVYTTTTVMDTMTLIFDIPGWCVCARVPFMYRVVGGLMTHHAIETKSSVHVHQVTKYIDIECANMHTQLHMVYMRTHMLGLGTD